MKNPYELLNQVDSRSEQYEEVQLNAAEKTRLKQSLQAKIKPRKKKNRKLLLAAAFILVTAGPLMLSNDQVWASLSKAGKQIELFFNKPENEFTGYKQMIEKTAADQDVHVTLNELMLDDGQILLSLNIKSTDPNRKTPIQPGELQVKIGELAFANAAYTLHRENKETEDGSWNYLYSFDLDHIDTNGDGVNDKAFQILDYMDSQKDYPVTITFQTMEYEKEHGTKSGKYSDSFGEIKGHWAFQTTVNGANIQSDTTVYRVDKEININEKGIEGTLKIKEIRVSPVSVKIHHTFEYKKGTSESHAIHLILKDEKGKLLLGSGTGESSLTLSEMSEEIELDHNIRKISITPSIFNYKTESQQPLKDQSFEVDVTKQ